MCSGLLASPSNASLFWALCVNSFVCVSRGWSLFLYLYSQLALCCSLSPSCVPLSSLPPLSQNRGTRQHQPLDTTVVTTSAAEPVSPLGCLPKEPSRGVPSLETAFLVAAGQKHTAWLAAILFFGGHQRQHRLPAGVFPPVSARREAEKAKGKYNVRWSDRLLSGVCPGGYTCWPSSSRKALSIELTNFSRREAGGLGLQGKCTHTFCFGSCCSYHKGWTLKVIAPSVDRRARILRLSGVSGGCVDVSRITRVPSSSEPKTNIPTEPRLEHPFFFFFCRIRSRTRPLPHLAITHTGNKGTWAGDSSSSSVYVSHGASIFYHLVRVTHNVSNDVSQGGRPLLAVGDNGSMAVSQRAAPGEVSL